MLSDHDLKLCLYHQKLYKWAIRFSLFSLANNKNTLFFHIDSKRELVGWNCLLLLRFFPQGFTSDEGFKLSTKDGIGIDCEGTEWQKLRFVSRSSSYCVLSQQSCFFSVCCEQKGNCFTSAGSCFQTLTAAAQSFAIRFFFFSY